MKYISYTVVAVPLVILMLKGGLDYLDMAFRWLAERNGF